MRTSSRWVTFSYWLLFLSAFPYLSSQCPLPFCLQILPPKCHFITIFRILRPRLVLTRHFWTPTLTQVDQTTQMRRNERYLFPQIIEELKQQSTIVRSFVKNLHIRQKYTPHRLARSIPKTSTHFWTTLQIESAIPGPCFAEPSGLSK